MNILKVNSSIYLSEGQSSRLADELVSQLLSENPGASVVVRDLARDPLPHLDAERFGAFLENPAKRGAAQEAVVTQSDALIAELRRADVIVLGVPMYNFGVPSQLKAWFDHIARAGVTFQYTDEGAVGLITGKKAYVAAVRGGVYAGTAADTQTAYVRHFLGFLGIVDVDFVYAEGLAMGPESRSKSLAAARDRIHRLVPTPLAA